ncbi:potassium channel family protein [Citrobacter amalonaticus]|uniref:potassium channel family protein n=1 Tax=Citrobacter amalonaticus TaxID=35703 RepID=UPI0004D82FD9|nr:potassium channel family protein [Citrobacter amalonaticus]KEY47692.1 hypothetical protein DQ02_12485 [Citrobacter amalonaticus]
MKLKPWMYLATYISLIFVFALLYWLWSNEIKTFDGEELSFPKSLYFSTVTITTLGYGDILPLTKTTMAIVASEVVLGIVIIGLFLSSLWQSFANRIEKQQGMLIKKRLAEQNLHKLLSFYSYLSVVINNYKLALCEVTTPLDKRGSEFKLNIDFQFSDLKDMFGPSLLLKNSFNKSVFNNYYSNLELVLLEFKFILSNFDLTDHPEIHANIIEFLRASKEGDVKEALESINEMNSDDGKMKKLVIDMIETIEPNLEKYKSNLVTPVIIFFIALKKQTDLILAIEKDIGNLKTHS